VVERLRTHYAALDARYGQTGTHALLTQVQVPVPVALLTQLPVPVRGRIIDVLVLASDPNQRIAIEVKVSRADYRSETDAKRAASWQIAHRCLYAAPAGLIDPASLPDGWGLYEVHETADAVLVEQGREHQPVIGADLFTDLALLRCAAAEDAIRLGDTTPAEVARLRLDIDRHAAAVQGAQGAREKYRKQAIAARSELLALEGMQECADCTKPVTWLRTTMEWTHPDSRDHKDCASARAERDRQRRESATGSKYDWGFPGDVEPKAIREALEAS
jgi:hypothetical protein